MWKIIYFNRTKPPSHPHLFSTGKFWFQTKKKVLLTPKKYFNQRLVYCTQKFLSNSDYIYFVHSGIQKLNLRNQINIAMRKVTSNLLTVGVLSSNFSEEEKRFSDSDHAFAFKNSNKEAPTYWKKFLFDVLAMGKPLESQHFSWHFHLVILYGMTYNLGHNLLELYNVLVKMGFTTSKMGLDL